MTPEVSEHRFHALTCTGCGATTRSYDPDIVDGSGYGERVVAHVALLSSLYRQSHRMVQQLLQELFGIEVALGSVNRLRQEASEAVAAAVTLAHQYVQQQAVVGMDETSYEQGNADGQNPRHCKGWLWVMVTPWVCYFQVFLSRSQESAKTLLGEAFAGDLTSDRYSAYTWMELMRRQLCWAHLKRDFTQLAERVGVSADLGQRLLAQQKRLFELWYQVRDGTLTRPDFIQAVAPIRQQVQT